MSNMAVTGIKRRVNIKIASCSKDLMCGWLYPSGNSTPSNPGPAIVLAHGLGRTKELKLDVYADSFNRLRYTCVVFDYRCSGGSEGLPRGLIDWTRQQEDWKSAIRYTRQLEIVDPNQFGLFGTSFSGGHVIQLAATDKNIRAVISQCPFTSGLRSSLCTKIMAGTRLAWLGLQDVLFGLDKTPITVSLTGRSGESKQRPPSPVQDKILWKLTTLDSRADERSRRRQYLCTAYSRRSSLLTKGPCSVDFEIPFPQTWLLCVRYWMPDSFYYPRQRFSCTRRSKVGICQVRPERSDQVLFRDGPFRDLLWSSV